MVRNLFAALLFGASIHRALADSRRGRCKKNPEWRDVDLQQSVVVLLHDVYSSRAGGGHAVEIRGPASRPGSAPASEISSGLARFRPSGCAAEDLGQRRGRY